MDGLTIIDGASLVVVLLSGVRDKPQRTRNKYDTTIKSSDGNFYRGQTGKSV